MKTIKITGLLSFLAIVIALAFTACSKEAMEPQAMNPGTVNNVNPTPPKGGNPGTQTILWGIHRHWDDAIPGNDGRPGCCLPPAVECFDDVVATGLGTYVDEFEDAIAGGASEIATFFTTGNYEQLFPDFDEAANIDYLEKLQSGNYYIVIDARSIIITTQTQTTFYKVYESGTTTLEFVLQLSANVNP